MKGEASGDVQQPVRAQAPALTHIPDEHTASRELYDAFVALGRQQCQQPASPPAGMRRRTRRTIVLVPIALLTVVAAAGATHVLLNEGPPVSGEQDPPGSLRPAQRDAVLAAARAADPGGGVPWGVRLYFNVAGGRCALAGQVQNGTLGVMRGAQFSALAPNAPGSCASSGADVLIAGQRSGRGASHRSVLFGYVDRSFRSVSIIDAGHRTEVPIAFDGSYIAVTASTLKGTLVVAAKDRDIRRKLTP